MSEKVFSLEELQKETKDYPSIFDFLYSKYTIKKDNGMKSFDYDKIIRFRDNITCLLEDIRDFYDADVEFKSFTSSLNRIRLYTDCCITIITESPQYNLFTM